jgi:transcriptional regulator with XRE-family HTH domain
MVGDDDRDQGGETGPVSTSEHVRSLRIGAGLSVAELAERAGVSSSWLETFEAGSEETDLSYAQLLALVRATQPPRPDWWDEGHEHDLHLPPPAAVDPDRNEDYWSKIAKVRASNRKPPA